MRAFWGNEDLQDLVLLVCVLWEREWFLMIVPVPVINSIELVKFFPYLCVSVCVAKCSHPWLCVVVRLRAWGVVGASWAVEEMFQIRFLKLHSA